MALKISMTTKRTLYFVQRPVVVLVFLLLHLNPSLAYSLKNCTISYFDRTPPDVFLDCTSRKLVTVPDDIPRNASIIHLYSNLIEQISRKDFTNMSKLRRLVLYYNQITHIEDGSFIHLGALTRLIMSSNHLTNLTVNIFQGLSNLTILDLSNNKIMFIHNSAFHFLSSLQTVMLDKNQLQQVSDIQPILQLPQLQELSISCNSFPSFETKDLLVNVPSALKVLRVSGYNMENISITTPIFPHLETIDIDCVQRDLRWYIPDKTLLKNITRLLISVEPIPFKVIRNVLQKLDSVIHLKVYSIMSKSKGLLDTVCKMPNLRSLDLSNNNVVSFSVKPGTCTQLTELDLTSDHITKLSIQSMKRLRSLVAENNLLTKVPDDIRTLSSLEILDLSGNQISELGCEDFINTTCLTELCLATNYISKLDSCVFQNLYVLRVLDMSHNLLWTVESTFTLGPQLLESLDLSENFVSYFGKGYFQSLGSLKYLDVISSMPGLVEHKAFDGLNNLESLSISIPSEVYYNFRELQKLANLTVYITVDRDFRSPLPNYFEAFYHLKSLKVFKIIFTGDKVDFPFDLPFEIFATMRHLEEFTAEKVYNAAPEPKTFTFNRRLKSLSIIQSDLSNLNPELFSPIPQLQVINFSNCKIKSLNFLAQARLPALRYLILRDNELSVIGEMLFQFLPALTYLDLENNPFTCDCSNTGFIQWVISNNQTQVAYAYQYTCPFPVVEHTRNLLDFDIQSCWMDLGYICFTCSTCLVVLTLLTSSIYHFLRWQLAYTFYLFLAFLYDSRKRKQGAPHQYDAFVSYNVHDEAWVYRDMLPVLEGEQGWRLCLHHRDFQPGKPIMENITDAIYGSRKTICVISHHYLQSEWCSREIQMASFRLFDEQKDVLILLFLEEIPAQQLSPYHRIRKLVKRRTYLSWPQAGQHMGVFWENVRRALETGDTATETTNLLTGPEGC
uniref:TIR domain-containing protein n=1 Tax=Monopterus albus TaxID=43700 RepID=A0A3Q3JP25_MONAL|nr:toll-like receptor 13 [Monopterus albus]XP_020477104.1 toll-like receptor 13 [Monopterus albus]